MAEAKKYNPDKSESLKTQFGRFASRMKHRWNKEPVTLDDINVIKLPSPDLFSLQPSYFASRNEGGKWNVDSKIVVPGGEVPHIEENVAINLELADALDLMAAKSPEAMKKNTAKYWHPVSVAKLVGHNFKSADTETPANKNAAKPAGMTA